MISSKDFRRLMNALQVAQESDYKYKHGAVIYKGGSCLSAESNRVKNSGRIVDHEHATVHAEDAAVRAAKAAKGGTLYVGRRHKNGEFAPSKPCPRCLTILFGAGIEKVVWTEDHSVQSARLRDIWLV